MSRFDNNCLWITGDVHDRIVFPVLVRVFGDEGETADLRFADPVEGHRSHDAAKFDLVQKFHVETGFGVGLVPAVRARSGFPPGQM